LRWLLPQSVSVVANSTFTRSLVKPLHDGVISVIPYGITVEPKPSRSRSPDTNFRILFVGRLDERKGVTYLLQALPQILDKQAVRLRIVGQGILESELKSECQRLGLEGVVDFLGVVSKEELANEYAACDVFVLPAIVDSKGDTEGLGIVMIEALAHQKPVVATNVGGIADVICHHQTGILVPEKDPIALADAILLVLAQPEWSAALGKRGLEDVSERFAWSRIVSLWQQAIDCALMTSQGGSTPHHLSSEPIQPRQP
jgi:glycosyltransferase involved in cell wall biosynthesis